MTARTLVVELLTEELPPKALKRLGEAFADGIAARLRGEDFLTETSVVAGYATPRRLAVVITQVLATAPDKPFKEKLLPVSVAFDAHGQRPVRGRANLPRSITAPIGRTWWMPELMPVGLRRRTPTR